MESTEETLFDQALTRYQEGAKANELLNDFINITTNSPNHSAGWTCLAWLQLLSDKPEEALRSARTAIKLNAQDPQARINLSLALLETNSKGVREQIEIVKKILFTVPELQKDLKESIADGLSRKPDWNALQKIKQWLEL
ncbi:hypothetical protein [Prochlorococcus sp. MIT 1341]|uniref:tetratricopeptide repeat protein n=1 Tax=Prochlorococcus sp. MIT 1341 TaxID=3096221 RepID=UPI002A759DD4|nr:hypothetical protein [Prochlorococcus sp. MIT 1341]